MLFELAYTVAERMMSGIAYEWTECIEVTLLRQRAFYDAVLPDKIEPVDQTLAEIVAQNLTIRLRAMSHQQSLPVVLSPVIQGWNGLQADEATFAIGCSLIEVKCTAKRFSASDYRQVAIYWLLSFAAAVEGRGHEWRNFVLLNPRSGVQVSMCFDSFLSTISSGRTKVDILLAFQTLVGSRLTR